MLDRTVNDWQALAGRLDIEGRAFINGRYVDAASGETRATVNPANGEEIALVALCGPDDADRAVEGARKAFESGCWSRMAPMDRKMTLVRWAKLVEEHADELALLETLDVGKPISDTVNVDVPSAIRTIRWSGEAIDKVYGEIPPTPPDTLALIQRLPLGVVAAIVPWNFPLSTTAWKLAPSLATGNSVILKPATNTPLSALFIARLAAEAGLPDGVLQVLPGPGGSLGKHLATHMDIDGLTFTGSTPVGKKLMQYSGQSNLKRTFLELGGKSPNIVFADADLDKAAAMAAVAVFYNGGQTCTAGTRLIVQEDIMDEFMDRVADRARGWMPGDPLDPATAMGPMIDAEQCRTVAKYVEIGREEGARIVFGGRQVMEETGVTVECRDMVGVYLWIHPQTRQQFLRIVYAAEYLGQDESAQLDDAILGYRWMSYDDIQASRPILRTPAVLRCVDDYRLGRRASDALLTGMVPLQKNVHRILATADLV